MNNSTISDINTSATNITINTDDNIIKNKCNIKNQRIFKQIWQLGHKHLVVLDDSIIQKLGITNNSTFFVEQELTHDNTTILMRINKFQIGGVEK